MNLKEYYDLPEGSNVNLSYTPTMFQVLPMDIPLPQDTSNMYSSSKIKYMGHLNLSETTSISNMFSNCYNLFIFNGPDWDVSNVTSANFCFGHCSSMRYVNLANWNTQNFQNMDSFFYECYALNKVDISHLNLSNVTSMYQFCYYANELRELNVGNTSNVRNFGYFTHACFNLIKMSSIDCSSAEDMSNFFGSWSDKFNYFTEFGGWQNVRCDLGSAGLENCPNLSYESCINILNGLYDFTANGETTSNTLKVHPNFIDKLTEEDLQIAIRKGWSITI